jgi:diaminopimelate decarboxylase
MRHFEYGVDGRLRAEGVDLTRIAAEVGTPCFVYAQATIERHLRVFDQAFAGCDHLICYAMKANSSAAVLATVAASGAGADIVSGGELFRARRAGIAADRIVFSGVGKREDEMAEALDEGILAFNVESEPELARLARVAEAKRRVAPVSLRVNPDVDAETHPYIATGLVESKFGVPMGDAPRLAATIAASPHLRLTGIDCHIGSQITSLPPILEALDSVLELVDRLDAEGHAVEHVDIGGGLGIPYGAEQPPHPSELGRAVVERMRGRSERLILEPGRVIVGNAGILLSRVEYLKSTPAKAFVILDAAMNDLIRPSLYQAYHEILPVARRDPGPTEAYDVVGPVCESGDTFARDRQLPRLEPGELVAIMSAGAYGFVMASTYNSRPRAAEVLVRGAEHHVVRRRETYDDLIAGESLPPWSSQQEGTS